MTCMSVAEAIKEARLDANTSNMSEACFSRLDSARTLADEVERLQVIIDAAWEVRREERDYNPCPDLLLRANARKRLHELLDRWKAAEAARKGK